MLQDKKERNDNVITKDGSKIFPMPDNDLFAHKEKKWRQILPDSYKEFLMENNGGVPVQNTFVSNSREYMIERFLCILKSPRDSELGMYDISVVVTQIEERLTDNEDLLGVEILPIAAIFAGDFVCLNFKDSKSNPSVCVWSHEESGEFEPTLYKIADNFSNFLEVLK